MGCNQLISDVDIEEIYKDDNLITTNQIDTLPCKSNDIKNTKIHIFNQNNHMCQHDNSTPILREYHRNYKLASPSSAEDNGKVAIHEQFLLKAEFRNQKIAKTIHQKELKTYVRLGFKEIQLEAEMDGLIVWQKMYFNVKDNKNISFIRIAIQKYLATIKHMSNKDIDSIIKKGIFKMPIEHLVSTDENSNFSNWIHNEYHEMGIIEMYKELT